MKKRYLAFLSIIVFLCVQYTEEISANSGYRYGTEDAMGILPVDKECPILVEKARLTFDLQEFPKSQYETQDEYLNYGGMVSAEYTLYNPTENTVKETFLLPIGTAPSYGEYFDEKREEYIKYSNTEKCSITVNGELVDKTLRHSLTTHRWDFEQEDNLQFLQDQYVKDDFYKQDLSVTRYTYVAKESELKSHDSSVAIATFSLDSSKTKVVVHNLSDNTENEEEISLEAQMDSDNPYVITVIGEPLEQMPEWKFYKDEDCTEEINGTMELVSAESFTFEQFVFLKYDEAKNVKKCDWYNSMLEYMNDFEETDGVISLIYEFDLSDNLMCWYEYDVMVKAKDRIVNTVTLPSYPEIGERYKPQIYEYTYMLLPNHRWNKFGDLDIVIDTPYYMVESEKEGFQKTDSGYVKHFKELPEEDLYFTLSENKPYKIYSINQILIGLTTIIIMIAVVSVLIRTLLCKKDK